jgi:uncharacterized protein
VSAQPCSSTAQHSRAAPAALYEATVRHVRRQTIERAFTHRVYYWLVDLDGLPALPGWMRPFAGFAARDHLGDPALSIRQNLDAYLATQGVDLHGGRVLMLANARVLGYVFNPLTVYWCHRADGTLECVLAEVHNTYRERHCYLLRPDAADRAETAKDFYVSPFLTVAGDYRMVLPVPDDRLRISITLRQQGDTALVATVTGSRRPATPATLARMLLRHPLVPQRTSALIRRHGIALWLRRLPVIPRPTHAPQRTPE